MAVSGTSVTVETVVVREIWDRMWGGESLEFVSRHVQTPLAATFKPQILKTAVSTAAGYCTVLACTDGSEKLPL